MIDKNPFDWNEDWSRSSCVTGMWEIPLAASSGDNELETSDQEGVDPESSEQVVQEDILSLFVPDDGGNEL